MRSGKLLHGDPSLYCEYKAYAYRDYIDSADLRRLEDRLLSTQDDPTPGGPACCALNSCGKKLQLIADDLARLLQFKDDTLATLTADAIRLAAVKRLLERIVSSAGLRNTLVHDYNDVDPKTLHQSIGASLQDDRRYLDYMDRFLQSYSPASP